MADCADKDDFVPCETVTDPDRAYDICIRGVCQSPGCGTVDCNPPGPHFPLGDSNQRFCAGGGTGNQEGFFVLDECPALGEDFFGQDAQFGWDTLHDHSERYTRTVPVPDEPIVEDHSTGLIWQGCNNRHCGADCEISVESPEWRWKPVLAHCDALAWGGYHDWRLPDRWEIESLVVESQNGNNISCDKVAFPDCAPPGISEEWTISSSKEKPFNEEAAFAVHFARGGISVMEIGKTGWARCVRGLPNPRPQARWERDTSIAHQPVVRDHWTGLVWQGCPKALYDDECESGAIETVTWKGALDYCAFLASLSWGGRDDWRVPSRHELSSIVDDRFVAPALDPEVFAVTYFDSTYSSATWTSTSIRDWDDIAAQARFVSMYYGELFDGGAMPKFENTVGVRCVAGGQE